MSLLTYGQVAIVTIPDEEDRITFMQNRISHLVKTNEALTESNRDNNQKFHESQKENLSLRMDIDAKYKMLREQEEKISSLLAEVDQSREKEGALRQIILGKAGNEKVSDQAMVSEFVAIRQKIQNLVRLRHYRMDQSVSNPWVDHSSIRMFFKEDTWGCLTTEERINRVRSKIFDYINTTVFNSRLFGLEGYEYEVRRGGESKAVPLESGFDELESMLDEGGGKLANSCYRQVNLI